MGSVIDLDAGVAYGSRTECIEALGRDVAVPLLPSRKKYKRLRIVTMTDKKEAMYKQGEEACAKAGMFSEWTVKDIELAAYDGYTADGFSDVASSLRAHVEDLEILISTIDEAGHYLSNQEELETLQHEFKIDIARDMADMVSRL